MDLQTFIQSGLLESYVLGQATAEERSLVERMLSQHAEARVELSAIEQAIERYALAQATPPPDWMKGRILDQIEHMAPAGTPAPVVSAGSLRLFQMLCAALVVGIAFLWYRNNNQIQTLHTEQQAQIASVQDKLNECSQRAMSTHDMVNLIRDSDTKIYRLGNGENGKGSALMYKNDVRGETALDLSGVMAPSAPGKYLQLWAIINEVPVSLGMVKTQSLNGWQVLEHHNDVKMFAISEENDPNGHATPTIVVMHS